MSSRSSADASLPLQIGEIVHEQLAIEVIHLVLDAHCHHSFEAFLVSRAGAVLPADTDFRGTHHLIKNPRD